MCRSIILYITINNHYLFERVHCMPKNKVIVRINGSEYTLMGEDSEDYLFSIANYVDKKVREVLVSNSKHSTTSAAVLTSLTLADDLFKARREIEMQKSSMRVPEEKIKEFQKEYDQLQLAYMSVCKEYEDFKQAQEGKEEDLGNLKEEYNKIYLSFMEKSDEYEKLLRESTYVKEQNGTLENKLSENDTHIQKLKDQLLENQIELVKVRKDYKDIQSKRRSG
ncbi:MAG: zapA [Clostridiales bacterium]|nr:zapA [Clostridiales bacterium]